MNHSHMAVGKIPEDLVNIVVAIQWTPGYTGYTLTLFDGDGRTLEGQKYECISEEFFDGEPSILTLDMSVYHGLKDTAPLASRLMQSLAGFGYLQWFAPSDMPGENRIKFEELTR